MAAFGEWPQSFYDVELTAYAHYYRSRGYTVLVVPAGGTTSYYDHYRHLDSLIKDFVREAKKVAARTFCGRPRERQGRCLAYKTPTGERGVWFEPQPPQQDLPCLVSLPRWREFARRRA